MDDTAAFIMNFSYLWFCVLAHRYVFFYFPCHKKRVKLILSFRTAADLEKEKNPRLCSREVFINGLQTRTMSCQCSCLVWSFTPKHSESLSSDLIYFSSQTALVNPLLGCIVRAKQGLSVEGWVWVSMSVVVTLLSEPQRMHSGKQWQRSSKCCTNTCVTANRNYFIFDKECLEMLSNTPRFWYREAIKPYFLLCRNIEIHYWWSVLRQENCWEYNKIQAPVKTVLLCTSQIQYTERRLNVNYLFNCHFH